MRKLIPLLLVLFCSLNAYPQWGIKGGLNYSNMTGSDVRKYVYGGHIGGTYDLKLSDKWYLQPELLFTSIGCKLEDDGLVLKGGHVNIYALELPVDFSFRPRISNDTKLLLDFGLYARCGLFGNKKYNYHSNPEVSGNPFDAYNRFDTGLNLGLGIQKNRYFGILSFQRGFSYADKGENSYHQGFRLSMGYKF